MIQMVATCFLPDCLPGGCHASVVVEALVKPAPIVAHKIQVKVIAGHLFLAIPQLLERPLPKKEGRPACQSQRISALSARLASTEASMCNGVCPDFPICCQEQCAY